MAGQFLGDFDRGPGLDDHRDEGVPEGVEVGDPAGSVAVGDFGGLQIVAEHRGRLLRQVEDRKAGGLAVEPRSQGVGQVGPDRLGVVATALRVGGGHGHGWRVAVEAEGLGRQAPNLARPEARPDGEPVEHGPLGAGHAEYDRPLLGGLDQPGQLLPRECPTFAATVGGGVEPLDVGQCILAGPAVAAEPSGETLDGPEVGVAGAERGVLRPEGADRALDPGRGQVRDALGLRQGDDLAGERPGQVRVFGGVPLGQERGVVLGDMLFQGAVFGLDVAIGPGVDHAHPAEPGVPFDLLREGLGRGLVGEALLRPPRPVLVGIAEVVRGAPTVFVGFSLEGGGHRSISL
ncbi:MAG TPA: hypothetical protein VG406_28755 [Isosphaeraceae bacterium]|nr:hypothetical protein [Isosphaeraceae bacterium]